MCPNKAMTHGSVVPVAALTVVWSYCLFRTANGGSSAREPRFRLIAHPAQQHVLSRTLRLLFRYAAGPVARLGTHHGHRARAARRRHDRASRPRLRSCLRQYAIRELCCRRRTCRQGRRRANPSADASCPFEFYGVDSCQDLAIDARGHALRIPNLHFQELDVLDALMKLNPAETPDVLFDAPLADISVCFGFMHHVPSCEYRVRVLDALVRQRARVASSPSVFGSL